MIEERVIGRAAALAPFEHDIFRKVWFASLASNLGALIQGVGAAWMMTSISDSADLVALVQASTALPIMLFSLVSGAIADNYNRRSVMLVAQVFMLAVSVALAVTAYAGVMTPWLLLSFTFLIGCGTALNNPSWQAAVGDMVPRTHLPAAVALNIDELQPDAQRRPGDRRRHRRRRRRGRGLCRQRRQLSGADRRAAALEAERGRRARCRANRWAWRSRPGCATSPCRPTSKRCCCAASSSA